MGNRSVKGLSFRVSDDAAEERNGLFHQFPMEGDGEVPIEELFLILSLFKTR